MTLHTNTHSQVTTSYTFGFLRYRLDRIRKFKVLTRRSKVKSKPHHDIAYLHPPTKVLIKYHFQHIKMVKVKVNTVRSKVKSMSHYDVADLHSPATVPSMYQFPTLRYSPLKILNVGVTKARSKVKSRSHHDFNTYTPTNVPNKCKLLICHGFCEIFLTAFPARHHG